MKSEIHAPNLLDKMSGRVDGAEVYQLRSQELPVRFAFGELESVQSVETAGCALRLIKDDRLGFATTTDLTDDTTLVRNALESAQFGDPAPFRFPAKQTVETVACFDREVEQLDENALIALGEEIVEEVQAYDDQLQTQVSIRKSIQEIQLTNTSGLNVLDRRTGLAIAVEVTRAREGDIVIIYDSASSHRRQDVDGLALARGITERFQWSERTAEVESKPTPVVFHRLGAAVPLLPLMWGLNGQQVFLGRGVDTDIVVASAKAYLFALNRLLAAQQASRRQRAITEEVRQTLEEMRARYGTTHTSDFKGWRTLRDEDLI